MKFNVLHVIVGSALAVFLFGWGLSRLFPPDDEVMQEFVEPTQEATATLPPGDGFMLLTGTVVELNEATAVIEANDGTRYTVLLTDEARDLRVGEEFTLFIVIQNPTATPNTP